MKLASNRLPGWALAATLLLAFVLPGPARADERVEDLATWIDGACKEKPGPDVLARIDQVAGKTVSDWLRTGRFRDAVTLANAYLACLERASGSADPIELDARMRALRQVVCFVPLVVFEGENRVDEGLAARAIARCPAPEAEPPADTAKVKRWTEDIRRYMHLLAASGTPEEVSDFAGRYLAAFAKAGLVNPDGASKSADEAPEKRDPSEAPDPVFAVRVLAVGASVGTGSIDRLVAIAGGDEDACKSLFLAALGLLQSFRPQREAALPLVLHRLVGRAPIERLVAAHDAAAKRFEGKECAVPVLVASLAMASQSDAAVDRIVADGRTAALAHLAARVPSVLPIRGSLKSRIAVLEPLAAALAGADKGRRLCDLGQALLADGRIDASARAFSEALPLLPEDARECAVIGRLSAAFAAKSIDPVVAGESARAFLALGPGSPDVLDILRRVEGDANRTAAVAVLWKVADTDALRAVVGEALVKLVDVDPGSGAASAAVATLPPDGGRPAGEEQAIWWMIVARHHAAASATPQARQALARAFATKGAGREAVRGGTSALLRWFAVRKKYDLLDEGVRLARKAKAVDAVLMADLATIVGEVGEDARAKKLLKLALALKPADKEEWLSIASAYARVEDTARASDALARTGPQESWGAAPWMVLGRIEMVKKRYREAANAYGKAVDIEADECEPRFFRGLVRLLLGDPEGAEADFRKCMDQGEKSPAVLGGLGYALFDQSRFDDAGKAFDDALKLDDKSADNHLGRAFVLLRQEKPVEAVAAFRRASELEPAMAKGVESAEKKGFVYSEVEKKAWEDLVAAVRAQEGGK